MNKFTLRFPPQMESKYEEFTRESCLFHFKHYQPILIIINLSVTIIQLKGGQIVNGLLESIITIFFILQIPFIVKYRKGKSICSVFVINNLIMTAIQILVDVNTPAYDNSYVSGCGIIIINITLLEHYDFVWNAFSLMAITTARFIYILFYFTFDGMAILYIVLSLYLFMLLYRKSYIKRTLFIQYQNEKEIRNILNEIIQNIYIQFKFDKKSFQFELKYANQYAEQKLGISNNQDFRDFLHQYSIYDSIATSKINQNQRSLAMESKLIGQFLYEKMIIEQTPLKKLEAIIQKNSSKQLYNIKLYAYQNENREILMLMEQRQDILQDDDKLKQKDKEIKLLSSKLDKINLRTNKQLFQLCQLQQNSDDRYYLKVSESLISGQIISNTKIKMILDAFQIYYFKINNLDLETFSLKNLIYQSLMIMNTVADVENKSIQFESDQSDHFVVTSIQHIIQFIFSNLLYLFLIQKYHRHIKVELSNLEADSCIALNFYIEGFISLEFLRQNTFIIQMIYKGLQIVGPKAEITTQFSFDACPNLLYIKIYKNLDYVLNG
ncbi:unnamed protein product (macronuclear) [Paramecium tetraurelia]|uniref:Transmembrane protein n=1 Tax=Paramecium tetraurelia TaxID=5888 RepID=A0BRG6_PARTE|nr:uncharacterized protein GSPATT00031364001 [Paramecium tetraurelia]CAK61133.1 unnamed protein product [Paramecium tetraurelia]|eukprot:XP_001428531.1 hypothetical protein (macronuclear) [Paramecium tetraurelia strain d4-2]